MTTKAKTPEAKSLFDDKEDDIFSASLNDFDAIFDNFLKFHGIENPFKSEDGASDHAHAPGIEMNHHHDYATGALQHSHEFNYEGSTE